MRAASPDLDQFLDSLARQAQPGERLPTIRELMQRFGASQMVVQRAFDGLKSRGLIASQVGRGTFFLGAGALPAQAGASIRPGAAPIAAPGANTGAGIGQRVPSATGPRPPAMRSVLLLRRSISITRGRVLAEALQRRFSADGHQVLEVSYTDPHHARTVLKGLPRFDACVVQSSFKTITIELLAALKDKSDAIAVDGVALVGMDVEAVGTEWGEPLAAAIALLRLRGHKRIAYASTSQQFLATQLGRRRFDTLQHTLADVELQAITVPQLPDHNYESALVSLMQASLDASGRLPFSALVAWGIEDGAKFRALLSDIGLAVPAPLSVVLLGRTDLANEHADFFDTVGCSVADQVDALYQAIQSRWADPASAYGVRLIPVTARAGLSTASVAAPGAVVSAPRSHGRRSRS